MYSLNEQEIQNIYGMEQAITDVKNMLQHKHDGHVNNPTRTVMEFPEEDGSVLYMPCTDLSEKVMSMKAVTIFPNNPSKKMPTTQGIVLLSDTENGEHVAMLNASYLTRLRTGAISGIATDRLAMENARTLAVIGTGGMAFEQVLGVLAVRPISTVLLYNPTKEKAFRFREKLQAFGIDPSIDIHVLDNVSDAVVNASIINCSTRSNEPVFDGRDVQPGTHVNGIGSYLPHMREVDFTFLKRAGKIVIDDFEAASEEAGELIHANKQSDWSFEDDIHGELIDLAVSTISGREDNDEITFFKSVGAAYYDLAVANGVYKMIQEKNMKGSVSK